MTHSNLASRPETGELEADPWRVVPFEELASLIMKAAGQPIGRPRIVAVEGHSAGGKTTIAAWLSREMSSAAVIHTDDIAWHHSFFGWDGIMITNVLEPLHRGDQVRYRPSAWEERGRPGAISVPPETELVIIEGVGAGRREFAQLIDAVVWMQSDPIETERRGIARDTADGTNGNAEESIAFWHRWMAEELPFVADQRPWECVCVIVSGTPHLPHTASEVVIAPSPGYG